MELSQVLREFFARRPQGAAYGGVILASLLATALAAALRGGQGEGYALVLFAPVICTAAVLAGLGPGLAATAAGLVAAIFDRHDPTASLLFALLGAAMSLGGEWLLRARRVAAAASAAALREREAHLSSIFDTAPDALIVIDEAGLVQSYSAAAERMFGWTAAEMLGNNIKMLMPTPYRQEHDSYVRRYLDTGERRIIGIGRIVVGERKDGSTFPMELAVGELISERGRFFTGFVRDLSERQAHEARLQELQGELIQISRLTSMGEMASALAHELNQPLSAAANYLSGARRVLEQGQGVDARAVEALDRANEQIQRAGEVIRRLRDFLARGKSERRLHSFSKLVREACALALVGAKEQGLRVRYEFDPAADEVVVDRVPIQQVVINLVRNAADAMAETTKRELEISIKRGEGAIAVACVADTGPGVSATVAAKLFQPFMTTKANGMGVGLSISRTIVEAHGGRIWTEPNPGGGARFCFSLQLAEAEGDDR